MISRVKDAALRRELWPFWGGLVSCFCVAAIIVSGGGFLGVDAQPIAFNHAKHIGAGLNCPDCHVGAEEEVHATVPRLEGCLLCHQAALTEEPEEQKLLAFGAENKELNWTVHTRMPAHVYFSHRRHVKMGGLECGVCHGPMESQTSPPLLPLAEQSLTMDGCIECHEQSGARADCNDCHR